jgi:hypothetical protein
MKSVITFLFLVVLTISASAQSDSFLTFKQKLHGADELVSVSVNGFWLRTAIWIANEDEDLRGSLDGIQGVRFVHVPARELSSRNLKVKGFEKLLIRDGFEEVLRASDDGDKVAVFMQEGKHENLYFLLIEGDNEVTAIEINGYIDAEKIVKKHCTKTLTSL